MFYLFSICPTCFVFFFPFFFFFHLLSNWVFFRALFTASDCFIYVVVVLWNLRRTRGSSSCWLYEHPCQFITVMQTWIFKSVFIYREVAEAVFIPGGGPHLAMEIHVLLHPMTHWLLVSLKTIDQEQHTSFCDLPCLSHQSQCLWSWQNTVL